MTYVNDKAMVENEEDFEKNWDSRWERFDRAVLYVGDIGEITNANKDLLTFPLYLGYNAPWDAHCCGTYRLSNKEQFEKAVREKIDELENLLESYKKMLDK